MNSFGYAGLFILMLVTLLGTIAKMRTALDELDINSFYVWSCIATIITGLPFVCF
jgi:hypothetical protein